MSLPCLSPLLKRGSHFAVVIAVVRLSPAHFRHDVRIDLGPQVVCDNALVVDIIPFQNACLLQFVECGDDLLKGAIDASPRLVNFGFHLLQFRFWFPLSVSYRQPRIPKDTGILKGWQTRIFAFASAENCGNSDTKRAGLRLTWQSIPASAERTSPIWKQGRKKRDCALWKSWQTVLACLCRSC